MEIDKEIQEANKKLRKLINKRYIPKKECRHKWRVGSGIGELINKKLVTTKLNIWCEKCNKKIKANYFPNYELKKSTKKVIKNKESASIIRRDKR